MAKIDFVKVEIAFDKGIRLYTARQLLYLAKLAATFGTGEELNEESPFEDIDIKIISLITLSENLKALHKLDKSVYKKMGITHKELKKYIENPKGLNNNQWESIEIIRENLEIFREELKKKLENVSNDDIVTSERKRHVNKRFNVNEKWLPLH